MATKVNPIGVVGYIDLVLAELTHQAPRALTQGEVEAVHRARVATRRLAAAISVCAPLMQERHVVLMAKATRRIRRSVQTLRDLDVMREHLRELNKRGIHPAACAALAEAMGEERKSRFEKVAAGAKLDKWLSGVGFWIAVRGGLEDRRERVRTRVLDGIAEQFAAFAAEADRLSLGLLGEGAKHENVQPHALRIAGKSLRYTLEMARAEKLGATERTIGTFKKLQDALGLWHDYFVLTEQILRHCVKQMAHPSYDEQEDELIQLSLYVLRMAGGQLRVFGRLWQKCRAALVEEIGQIGAKVPRNASGNESLEIEEPVKDIEAETNPRS